MGNVVSHTGTMDDRVLAKNQEGEVMSNDIAIFICLSGWLAS